MLASDLNNPDFQGARNPDDMLHVEFYDFAAIDLWKSQEQQMRVILPEVPYVRIQVPGNKDSIVETPADDRHRKRFPRQWQHYLNAKMPGGEDMPGYHLKDWPELDAETVRNLNFLRFHTVEQLAGASDAQIGNIGMNGIALREKAKRALMAKSSEAANLALAKRDTEISELKDQMAQMSAMMAKLMEPEKRGPGRPPKET